ncbi:MULTISPECIES: nitronate monooxygenase [Bacillaceae]|uniref:NAD(P)H-dependent flavin oxidoreductase n=1 Tax=Bacillaceae TaxID=186817 RepID=UPI00119E5698|nr:MULTISPECIES: nitronate monooxygenase [Bacillaceae]MCM3124993.1 nitronate monooxygenase [Mesobacillus sp. MER 33]MCM3235247.1 nitronate monooxygenase [Mesobacillus sp. MER 48]
MLKNEMTELLNIEYPIIQAPMAGGITTSQLVSAVSNSGGLGMVGAGYMSPDAMQEQIKEIKQLTTGNFGVNLFVPNEFHVTPDEIESAENALKPIREKLKLEDQRQLDLPDYKMNIEIFEELIQIVINENIRVCSFTFGLPPKEIVRELKTHNIILLGTATTVREAIEAENSGMDAVIVQGSEAGGHRGNFISGDKESLIGLISLIPQVADHVKIPVIAAGGIMDGRGLMASLCLGAKAVQMGTAFLTCTESGAHQLYKNAILDASEDQMVLTNAFSGKWARGMKNRFIEEMQEKEVPFPQFPVQNALTQSIRKASAAQNNPEFMSLWSGQSPRLAKTQSAEDLIRRIVNDANNIHL